MDRHESWTEVLARLRPLLETIFAAYGISPEQAQEVVEETCLVLISKRPRRRDPEGWLLRTVVERCRRLREERDREEEGGPP
jgi:DNA-directed RNA polymerase specialized sigma24 family protein